MAPEQTGWNGSHDRPGVVQSPGLIRKGDLDVIDIAWRSVAQHPGNESVDEFAERTMVERERLSRGSLTPMERVLPTKPSGSQSRR
jgi:hypothetical protein